MRHKLASLIIYEATIYLIVLIFRGVVLTLTMFLLRLEINFAVKFSKNIPILRKNFWGIFILDSTM